ncbi:hypothetical protein AAFF_G00126680 [Aldrovandia affinis]|uniref:Uncharacterized protein n=1 Tax=Aldrovandia affinis TaxID=143900 RepID=A0AAD7RRJ3_9TELE|nr:hypothetical protein AAFF_G00126680 [Aldrovandia affinis]
MAACGEDSGARSISQLPSGMGSGAWQLIQDRREEREPPMRPLGRATATGSASITCSLCGRNGRGVFVCRHAIRGPGDTSTHAAPRKTGHARETLRTEQCRTDITTQREADIHERGTEKATEHA